MKLLIVIGTRPNFIKVTRFKEIAETLEDFSVEIVHTGQHYDQKCQAFFSINLNFTPTTSFHLEVMIQLVISEI